MISIRTRQESISGLERWKLIGGLLAFVPLIAGAVGFAIHNLGNRYFWTDESSSLFTSLGWPGVGEGIGGLSGAWNWTIATHVEPGLYNLMERFWAILFGTQIEVLRVYPFLFFVIYMAAVIGVGLILRLPGFLIAGILGLALLENITPYYAVELRPSSAGLAASVAIPLLALMLLRRPTAWMLTLYAVGFVLLGSMQYNSVPIEFAVGLVLLVSAVLNADRPGRKLLFAGGLCSIAWLPLVYVITRGNPLEVAQDSQLDAIPEALIPNMEFTAVLSLLQQNLLSPTALPRTVFVLLIPVLWLLRRWPRPFQTSDPVAMSVTYLWSIVLIATLATAGIGFLGVMPWIVGTRWSIAEVGLIVLSLLGLAGASKASNLLARRRLAIGAMILSIGIASFAGYRLFTYERFPGYDWGAVFPLILIGAPTGTVIDTEIHPDLRYWIELSGDFDQYSEAWKLLAARTTSEFDKADASSVVAFLDSDADRLLLGDRSILDALGAESLNGLTLIDVPILQNHPRGNYPQPVLLIKDS